MTGPEIEPPSGVPSPGESAAPDALAAAQPPQESRQPSRGMPFLAMVAPVPTRRLQRPRWLILGAVLALLLVLLGGGAAYAIAQYRAPADAATTFCGHLKAQRYAAAYSLLSATLRGQLTQAQYTQASTTLDMVQGKITACGQASTGDAYRYQLGASTATIGTAITRAKAGESRGDLRLVREGGAWKVDHLDTALIGVSFGALGTASAYCQDLATQNYTAAYGLLAHAAQARARASDYTAQAKLQDQVDGKVTACALAGLGTSNTEASARLTVRLTRVKLGERQGDISLTNEGGAWKIAAVDQQVWGTDITGLAVATRFCADITSANYADAYTPISPHFRGGQSEAQFAANFTFADLGQQIKVAGMRADPATYRATGATARVRITVTYQLTTNGNQAVALASLTLARAENGTWQVDDLGDA